MTIESIRSCKDLQLAFKRLETIFQAEHGTAQADERDALVTLIEAYENEHCDFGKPDPVAGIGLPGKSPLAGLRSETSAAMTPPAFRRYLGIHYSGAETPDSGLKNLRVYSATPDTPPQEVLPPPGPRRYWSRRELAHWLAELLAGDMPTIVGIDHALSFPLRYFEVHRLEPDWMVFLEDFHSHWPTGAPHTYVDFILTGARGAGAARMGNPRWMRLTDERCRAARSVFQFEGQGKVAAATHAGLPWILFLKWRLGERLHVWPFDGWDVPAGKSALVEVRPAMWLDLVPVPALGVGQKDAFATASWLKGADGSGELSDLLQPALSLSERVICGVEGWILGAPVRP